MLELVTLEIRRPIRGLEYNSLRKEKRGNNLRGLEVTPLQPPAPLSTSLSMLQNYLTCYKTLFISFYDSALITSTLPTHKNENFKLIKNLLKQSFCTYVHHLFLIRIAYLKKNNSIFVIRHGFLKEFRKINICNNLLTQNVNELN